MRHGEASGNGERKVTTLLHELSAFRPANAGEATVQSQELQSLENVHNLRHERLADNETGLSAFQWTSCCWARSSSSVSASCSGSPTRTCTIS